MLSFFFYLARYRLWKILPQRKSMFARIVIAFLYLIPPKRLKEDNRLRLFFQQLGPVFIKLGQFLSTRPDILPIEITRDLAKLQSKVPPFAGSKAQEIIETQLQSSILQLFNQFDLTPVASGSLAQVHRAELKSGEIVAVKVLRPQIQSKVKANLRLLRFFTKLAILFYKDAKRLRVQQLMLDYSYFIGLESSLKNEAANCQRLRDNFKDNPIHVTPQIYWNYSTDSVLTMQWVDGIPVDNIEEILAQKINLKTLAELGVKMFFIQVFEHNLFHADMHPGNIFVAKNLETDAPYYISVDCAVLGSHSDAELLQLALLWLKVFRRDYIAAAKVMIRAKWLSEEVEPLKLANLIARLFEPLAGQALKDVAFSLALLELFEQSRPLGLQMQPSQLLLQKTLMNIEGLGKQLYPELDMFSIAIPFLQKWLLKKFNPKVLGEKITEELLWQSVECQKERG